MKTDNFKKIDITKKSLFQGMKMRAMMRNIFLIQVINRFEGDLIWIKMYLQEFANEVGYSPSTVCRRMKEVKSLIKKSQT